MKLLYLDCGMGAAGDMLTAALLELLPEPDAFLAELNSLGLPGVAFRRECSEKCGIRGSHISVLVHGAAEECDPPHEHHHDHETDENHPHHHHHHSDLHEIEHIFSHLAVSDAVRENALAVYRLIAEAESAAHGVPVSQVHFHEVGALDAIADVTAVCLLMERLAPAAVIASPVHVGCGEVRCAHGVLPVPAPATAHILRGVPIYGGAVRGELCTPTGAALLRHFCTRFGDLPAMRVQSIGYGMGTRDFPRANCVRALLGEVEEAAEDTVLELRCNLDDMTPERIAFAMDQLLAAGALDVWTQPIGMKKSRPGTMLCLLCRESAREAMLRLLFRHTSTLGVREACLQRHTLAREEETVQTSLGALRRKTARGFGVVREKWEYEDLARLAAAQDLPLEALAAQLDAERAAD